MTPPARPTASLAPVCSGCQCVLISVWMRLAARRAPDGREQRIGIGGKAAVDHQRAVWAGHRDHVAAGALEQRRAAQIGGRDSWSDLLPRRPADTAGAAAHRRARPRRAAESVVATSMPRTRLSPARSGSTSLDATTSSVGLGLVDRLMNPRLTQRPDVRPDALRWTQHRPRRALRPSAVVAPSSRSSAASSLYTGVCSAMNGMKPRDCV